MPEPGSKLTSPKSWGWPAGAPRHSHISKRRSDFSTRRRTRSPQPKCGLALLQLALDPRPLPQFGDFDAAHTVTRCIKPALNPVEDRYYLAAPAASNQETGKAEVHLLQDVVVVRR